MLASLRPSARLGWLEHCVRDVLMDEYRAICCSAARRSARKDFSVSWMTGSVALRVRDILRSAGLVRVAMVALRTIGYEKLFTRAMQNAIKPGDCVWDVGANIGVYSQMFSKCVTSTGHVFSFEPLPETVLRLEHAVAGHSNVRIIPVALSSIAGTAVIERGDHEDGATARIAEQPNVVEGQTIQLETGDSLVNRKEALTPSVVKIDVEGHELEVLLGMESILKNRRLRHLFIEIHFAILRSAGKAEDPGRIEKMLKSAGFSLSWVDQSHLHAARP
jgi:FkbM family methyltransferase